MDLPHMHKEYSVGKDIFDILFCKKQWIKQNLREKQTNKQTACFKQILEVYFLKIVIKTSPFDPFP